MLSAIGPLPVNRVANRGIKAEIFEHGGNLWRTKFDMLVIARKCDELPYTGSSSQKELLVGIDVENPMHVVVVVGVNHPRDKTPIP